MYFEADPTLFTSLTDEEESFLAAIDAALLKQSQSRPLPAAFSQLPSAATSAAARADPAPRGGIAAASATASNQFSQNGVKPPAKLPPAARPATPNPQRMRCQVVRLRRSGGAVLQGCDVYIGRACMRGGWQLPQSKWHNPFTVFKYGSAAAAVAKFESYLRASPSLLAAIPELRGKVLGCWCKERPSDPCHGDVLAHFANALPSTDSPHHFALAQRAAAAPTATVSPGTSSQQLRSPLSRLVPLQQPPQQLQQPSQQQLQQSPPPATPFSAAFSGSRKRDYESSTELPDDGVNTSPAASGSDTSSSKRYRSTAGPLVRPQVPSALAATTASTSAAAASSAPVSHHYHNPGSHSKQTLEDKRKTACHVPADAPSTKCQKLPTAAPAAAASSEIVESASDALPEPVQIQLTEFVRPLIEDTAVVYSPESISTWLQQVIDRIGARMWESFEPPGYFGSWEIDASMESLSDTDLLRLHAALAAAEDSPIDRLEIRLDHPVEPVSEDTLARLMALPSLDNVTCHFESKGNRAISIAAFNQISDDEIARRRANGFMNFMTSRNHTSLREQQLKLAIRTADVAKLESLIPSFPQGVNTRTDSDQSTMLLDAIKDDPSTMSALWLLDHGVMVEGSTRKYTPLFVAAEDGHASHLRLLLWRSTNMRGEFDFNEETALSISAAKLCLEVSAIELNHCTSDIRLAMEDYRAALPDQSQKLLIHTFAENPDRAHDVARQSLMVLCQLLQAGVVSDASDEKLELFNKLQQRTAVFLLVHEMYARNNGNKCLMPPSWLLSSAPVLVDRKIRILPQPRATLLSRAALEHHVSRLNEQSASSSSSSTNSSAEPKFFIANFRGVHCYNRFFPTPDARERYLRACHLNRLAPAPALYPMSGVAVGQDQLLRESVASQNATRLTNTFDAAPSQENRKVQALMSNDYKQYLGKVESGTSEGLLHSLHLVGATQYPHFATSDMTRHALRYGYGLKPIPSLTETRLRPEYSPSGEPTNQVLGKIFLCLFSPKDLATHRVARVSTTYGAEISNFVRPERETSYTGSVKNGHLILEALLRVPDFSRPFTPEIEKEFGLDQNSFADWKKKVCVTDGGQRVAATDALLATICEKRGVLLLKYAVEEALMRGGHLIFCHENDTFGLDPAPLLRFKKNDAPCVFQYERDMLSAIAHLRFQQPEPQPAAAAATPNKRTTESASVISSKKAKQTTLKRKATEQKDEGRCHFQQEA